MRAARFSAANRSTIVVAPNSVCLVKVGSVVHLCINGWNLNDSEDLDMTFDEAAAELDAALRDERSIDA